MNSDAHSPTTPPQRTTESQDYHVPGNPRGRLCESAVHVKVSWLMRDILRRAISLIVLPIAFSFFLALAYVLVHSERVSSVIENSMSMIGIAGQTLPGASVWWCTLIGFGCRKMDSTSRNSASVSNVTLSSVKNEVQSASKVIGGMRSLPDTAEKLNGNLVQHCSRSHLILGNYELLGRSSTPYVNVVQS
jgi:hypothetical protein